MEIVARIPNIDKESIYVRGNPRNVFSNIIDFRFENNLYPITVELFFIDGRVGLILLSENLGETIASAITVLGDPRSVFVSYYRDYIPVLFNKEIGVAILYNDYYVPRKLQGNIHPDIEIGTIAFFDPDSFSLILESGVFSALVLDLRETLEIVYPWDGYGDIEEKYRP